MKRLLLSLALATSLSVSAVAAEAPVTDHIPAFQTKIVENGEPIAGKPGQLRDFLEMRHTRGFSKAVLPDLKGKQVALEKMRFKPTDVVVLTVSGRGDKDIETYLSDEL